MMKFFLRLQSAVRSSRIGLFKRRWTMDEGRWIVLLLFLAFLLVAFHLSLLSSSAIPVLGNRFIMAQLRVAGDLNRWDPYPLITTDILSFLHQTTSVKAVAERHVVSLSDAALFKYPFILYTASGQISFTEEERQRLKKYLTGGGFLLVEDRDGEKGGAFDHSFRNELKKIFPEKSLSILPREHAIFRSFYLLRTVSGRKLTNNYLEGLEIGGRTALVYSQNDILGAWAKDLMGNFLFPCNPGGEAQRWEAQKLTMNIILYSLTGTYKTDAIHIPFIEEKLRR